MGGSRNPAWKYDSDGDKIAGWLIGIKHNAGKYKQNVYALQTEDGNVDVWGSTVLDRQLENLVVRRNAVQITYHGEAMGEQGKYHNFEVVVVPTDPEGKQIEGEPILKSVISPEDQAERDRVFEEHEVDEDLAERED